MLQYTLNPKSWPSLIYSTDLSSPAHFFPSEAFLMASFHLAQMSVGFQGTLQLVLFFSTLSSPYPQSHLFSSCRWLSNLSNFVLPPSDRTGIFPCDVSLVVISCQQKLSMFSRGLVFSAPRSLCCHLSWLLINQASFLFVSLHPHIYLFWSGEERVCI